jgi:hypothetical protein
MTKKEVTMKTQTSHAAAVYLDQLLMLAGETGLTTKRNHDSAGQQQVPSRQLSKENPMNTSCSNVLRFIRVLALTGILTLVGLASQARAQSLIWDPTLKNCTQQNCGAVFFNGISQKNAFGDSIPFTVQVFANAGECLRLEVAAESADMKAVVVSPSGTIWRNDDFYGLRPLVTALADVKGYYTVHINYWNGNQPTSTPQLFTLAYGRYVSGTPTNCPSTTTPFLAEETSKGN